MGRTSAPGLAPQDTPAAAVQPLLRTQGLSLRAAGRWLIKGLDWEVRAGERWCVVGRNATGKSTLLRALAGLPVPERQGQVFWLGRPQADWPAADAALLRAFAPQQAADRFPVSVQQLLALSTVRPGALRAAEVLAALDAAGLAERGVLQLSGGERQRVALAQCALQGAPLMLMDEPVSFQDPAHQAQVSRWLAQLVADSVSEPVPESVTHSVTDSVAPASPAALVLTAHDVNWIARTATHVLALSSGPSDTQQGRWHAGTCADLLNAALLEQVYGCPWRSVGGFWVTD